MLKNYIKNDQLNRNTQVSFSGETIATYSFTWILNDSITYWNNKTITQSYDDLLRLTSLNNWVQIYNYTYDDVNNITSDSVKNYSYDDVYRVVWVNNSLSGTLLESFNYDNAGNRTNDLNNEYNTNVLNQYTSLSWATLSWSLTYDNNWNLKQNSKYKFSYDYKNRLVKVTNISWTWIIAEFKYDVLGRRYEKKVWNETINYVYSDKNIIEEIRNNWTRNFKKEYINGLWIDNVLAFDSEENWLSVAEKEELSFCNNNVLTNTWWFVQYGWNDIVSRCESLSNSWSLIWTNRYYLHKNHLGSVVAITNNSWSVVTEYDYDVFGKASIVSWSDVGNTILYTWREFDKEIWLYYFRARYYDAELGRFINRDPIGQVDDVNLYGYVGNNGVMFVDPMGLSKTLIIWFTWKQNLYAWWWNNIFWEPKSYRPTWEVIDWTYVDSWISDLINKFDWNENYDTKLYYGDFSTKTWIDPALEYILKNQNSYDRIIIVWHSLWWDNAIILSNYLNDENIKVDLLVTLDIKSWYENDTIQDNVSNAINYYQTNGKEEWKNTLLTPFTKGEDIEPAFFNNSSVVRNKELKTINWKNVEHKTIDGLMVDPIYNLITK